VEGVGKSNLRSGIGHIPGTAALGQAGNCALAGHRNYAFKKFFRRLDELEPGDEIIISTKKEDLKYTVNGKKVVTPEDVSVLSGSKDESIISLITCTPVYVASHRLIVTAELTGRTLREP
jgi:sortase A